MAIADFIAGTQPSASHLNQLVRACNLIDSLTGDALVNVRKGPGGTTIGLNLGMLLERIGHSSGAAVPFVVEVEKDGGVSGGSAAECTWTYTVKDLLGNTLGTALTPQVPRLHYVAYWYGGETRTAPAVATSTYGLAVQDGTTLVLLVAFGEIQKEDVCP